MRKINQLKAGSIMSYIQLMASVVISLVYTPLMLSFLGQAEYGIYSIATGVVSYLTILNFGFGSSYIRFYSKDKSQGIDPASTNGLFLTVFLVLGSVCLVAGFTLVTFAKQIFADGLTSGELATLKKIMSVLTVSTSITLGTTVFSSIITAHEKFVFQKSINLLKTICNPFLSWIFLMLGYRSLALSLVTATMAILIDIFNVLYCLFVLKVKFNLKKFDFRKLKEVGAFSAFVALNSLIDQINWNVDKVILGRYCGATVTAVYSLSAYINTLYQQVSTAISTVFIPRVNKLVVENKDMTGLNSLFVRIGRYQLIILLPILLGFIFLGRQFVSIWAPDGYGQVYTIALLLIVPATVPYMQNIGISIQTAMAKHRVRSVIYACMAVVNMLISIPFAKTFGAIGSALGTTIALVCANIGFMNIYYHKRLGLNMIAFWKSMLSFIPAILFSSVAGVLINIFANITNYFTLLIYACIFALVYFLSLWKFTLNESEKGMLIGIIRKFLRR